MAAIEVYTLGETLVRLTAPPGIPLEAVTRLDVHAAGAESNVAIALSRLGMAVSWISVLPNNSLGRLVLNQIRLHGVDVSLVRLRPDARMGLYFLQPGQAPRPPEVIYDRRGSAFALARPEDIPWERLAGGRLLHITGIGLAVNPDVITAGVAAARRQGLAVSLDVNFRARLWSPEQAREAVEPLLPDVEVLFCKRLDAIRIWGLEGSAADVAQGLAQRFGLSAVAVTDGSRGAAAVVGGRVHEAPAPTVATVDRIGAGDAFAAGFLYGYLGGDRDRAVTLGVRLAALKHTFYGDAVWIEPDRLEALETDEEGDWR